MPAPLFGINATQFTDSQHGEVCLEVVVSYPWTINQAYWRMDGLTHAAAINRGDEFTLTEEGTYLRRLEPVFGHFALSLTGADVQVLRSSGLSVEEGVQLKQYAPRTTQASPLQRPAPQFTSNPTGTGGRQIQTGRRSPYLN